MTAATLANAARKLERIAAVACAALLLCTALLAAPPYLSPIAGVMHLVPPTPIMWAVILGSSTTPLVVIQAVMLTPALLRQRA